MQPQYFKHVATVREIELFLKGLQEREHAAWERARYEAFYSVAPYCKDPDPEIMGKFPWERIRDDEAVSIEEKRRELEELRICAAERDARYFQKLKEFTDGRRDAGEVITE